MISSNEGFSIWNLIIKFLRHGPQGHSDGRKAQSHIAHHALERRLVAEEHVQETHIHGIRPSAHKHSELVIWANPCLHVVEVLKISALAPSTLSMPNRKDIKGIMSCIEPDKRIINQHLNKVIFIHHWQLLDRPSMPWVQIVEALGMSARRVAPYHDPEYLSDSTSQRVVTKWQVVTNHVRFIP